MKVEILSAENMNSDWTDVYNAAMTTIGKEPSIDYPTSAWKRRILMAEHSPIRLLRVHWIWTELPYWVSVHFARHKVGIEHYVKTQRPVGTESERAALPQGALVNHECVANAQAIINISRKRLCFKAATETREAWEEMLGELNKTEPELVSVCVRECVYRGHCPEMKSCGYSTLGSTYMYDREQYLGRWEWNSGRYKGDGDAERKDRSEIQAAAKVSIGQIAE